MAFNSQYDGLNLTPAFTFPEDHSYANEHSVVTSEDLLAQPHQSVSLPNFYCIGVAGRAHHSLQNLWTPQGIIAFAKAGPSRFSVEHQRDPLADWYASSSFPPAFDTSSTDSDVPASYTTLHGTLNEISGDPRTRLEVCG